MNSDGECSDAPHPLLTGHIPNHIPSENFDPVLSQFRHPLSRPQWGTLELTRGDIEGVIKAKDPDLTIEHVLEMIKRGDWYDFSAIGEHFDQGQEWASSFYKLAVALKWIKGEDWWNGLRWWREKQELAHQRRIRRELRKLYDVH